MSAYGWTDHEGNHRVSDAGDLTRLGVILARGLAAAGPYLYVEATDHVLALDGGVDLKPGEADLVRRFLPPAAPVTR